jgi:mannose-6-phosphate isomerase-like protein (cupin superfamily)
MDEPGRARYRYLLLVDADGGPTAGVIHGIAELEGGSGFEALHRHNLTQTAHVLSGRGTVTLGERQVAAAPGDTFYIPAGTFHAWEAGAETLRLFWSYPCDRFDEVEYHFADGAR